MSSVRTDPDAIANRRREKLEKLTHLLEACTNRSAGPGRCLHQNHGVAADGFESNADRLSVPRDPARPIIHEVSRVRYEIIEPQRLASAKLGNERLE